VPRPRTRAVLLAGVLAAAAAARARDARAEDREPKPRAIFFPEPDAEARRQMVDLVETSFGDVTKAVEAREVLVRRFGPWSAPVLAESVDAAANQTETWNAALTLGTLRRVEGPSPHLAVAVRPLTKLLKAREPYRRAFAALALGCWYGPDSVRRAAPPREGAPDATAGARQALNEAREALVQALGDDDPHVRIAARLALAKIGGMAASSRLAEFLRKTPPDANVEARAADLIPLGLLPGRDEARVLAALKDGEARVRAQAALAISCWAVGQRYGEGAETEAAAAARAAALDPSLQPAHNVALRMSDRDGAEAAFARGMLALLAPNSGASSPVWEELYALSTTPSTDGGTATAAAQALLFSPAGSPVRAKMADLAGRNAVGLQALKEPVLAAFLLVAGSDGTPTGVHACARFLKNKARDPKGRVEYDVRYHAAIGLVRALQARRVAPEARALAVEALAEGVRASLASDPGEPSFRAALEQVMGKGVQQALLVDPDLALPATSSALLEAAFEDPDALTALDPIDVVVDRLNDSVWLRFGLEAVSRAAVGSAGGVRTPSREDVPLRVLLNWLDRYPYFTRLDLHRDRGRVPAPAVAQVDLDR
jgi:hypothetical protein